MAKTKPSGTRTRRAIADQLAMGLLAQLSPSGNHLSGTDFKQALIRTTHMAVAGIAGSTAQHDTARAERTVTRWIGGSEDRDHGNAQGRREMHGAGVAPDEQTCTARECNQLRERSGECLGGAAAGGFYAASQAFFSGAEVNQGFHAIFRELPGDFAITFGRPLLGSPAGARV